LASDSFGFPQSRGIVFGFNRIPIVAWLREQATESLTHAQQAGKMITHLGAYPSLTIGPLLDTQQQDFASATLAKAPRKDRKLQRVIKLALCHTRPRDQGLGDPSGS
jgi:bacterioferritin (cytochrome b1)